MYAIFHCLGNIATATALLHGDIEACWLCGMTCSQVFNNLIYSKDNNLMARHQTLVEAYRVSIGFIKDVSHVLIIIQQALGGSWFSCGLSTPPS